MAKYLTAQWGALIAVFLLSFVSMWDSGSAMVVLWLTTDTYMHGAFVMPLAFVLAKQMPWPKTASSPLPMGQTIVALLIWGAGILIGRLSMLNVIQQIMLIGTIPLIVLLCYGWSIVKHYWPPLMLVFFAVPVGDFLIPTLQSITADMAVFFLQSSGVSVLRNGWYLSIAAADFRVAEACSGINFLISTFTVAVFYAFFYMEKTYKRVAFICMGLLVPLLANGVRVYLIIMIAHWGDVESATGFDHLVYGWIFFVVILFALFAIGQKWQDPPQETESGGVMLSTASLDFSIRLWLFPIMIFIITATSVYYTYAGEEARYVPNGNAVIEGDLLSPDYPAADSVTKQTSGNWAQYEIVYLNENHDKKLIGYQNRWFNGKVWSIESSKNMLLSDSVPVKRYVLADLKGNRHQLLVTYCVGGKWSSQVMKTKMHQVRAKMFGVDFGGRAYAWFAPLNVDQDDLLSLFNISASCAE